MRKILRVETRAGRPYPSHEIHADRSVRATHTVLRLTPFAGGSPERVLDSQAFNLAPVLEVFAIEGLALAFKRGR